MLADGLLARRGQRDCDGWKLVFKNGGGDRAEYSKTDLCGSLFDGLIRDGLRPRRLGRKLHFGSHTKRPDVIRRVRRR